MFNLENINVVLALKQLSDFLFFEQENLLPRVYMSGRTEKRD